MPDPKSSKKKRKKGAKSKATNNNAEEAVPVRAPGVSNEGENASKPLADAIDESEIDEPEALAARPSTETSVDEDPMASLANGLKEATLVDSTSDASARFEALVKDRDTLRVEVSELRKAIEELQAKHRTDLDGMREQLQETEGQKEEAVEQYQTLLGKVNTIQERLKERLKADAVRWLTVDSDVVSSDMHVERPRPSKDTHRRT